MMKTGVFVPFTIAALAAATAAASDSWPSFQNGGELTRPSGGLPTEWSLDAGIAWRAPIDGTGQSSPVIQDGRIYVTSVSGANKETYHLSAYSLADGSKVWQKDFANPSPQENSGYVSLAAPTPAADAGGVICFFEGGNLVALTPDGEPRWQRDLVAEYGPIVSRHGLSASIEQNDTLAFIWVERQDDPYVMAVKKETGENAWKVGGIGATSWASPRLIKVGDRQHLVLSAIGSLSGLDPPTGERLWKFEGVAGNSTPTPSPAGDSRFLIGATTGQGASGSFERLD